MVTGTGIGTLLYMAPQLVIDEKPKYSAKCDCWSIGILMYYLLFGYYPWSTKDVENVTGFKIVIRKEIKYPKNC